MINVLLNNPKTSFDDLSNKLHIQKSAVKKHINALKKKGYLLRIGGIRGYLKVINY
ncbi:MAG: winged helix-turn-helix domain-containing protein [Bacteroidales bacterium]|nr:winged helix-turn-helix domain-containing protein [Bacteroidales bacterium]